MRREFRRDAFTFVCSSIQHRQWNWKRVGDDTPSGFYDKLSNLSPASCIPSADLLWILVGNSLDGKSWSSCGEFARVRAWIFMERPCESVSCSPYRLCVLLEIVRLVLMDFVSSCGRMDNRGLFAPAILDHVHVCEHMWM